MAHEISYAEIVICLFDGDYKLGVAALANSLVKSQFKGLINVGYRGDLPFWVEQLESIENDSFLLAKEIVIKFEKVYTEMHLGYYKPYFIKQTMDEYTATQKFYFFDADIIVYAPWTLYSKWLEKGVCLCLDNAFHFLHYNHPWRKDWRSLDKSPEKQFNDTNYYFNSGFIGLERESISLIDKWIYFTEIYIQMGGNINVFVKDAYSSFKGDQDLLNAAITTSNGIEISIVGKEGMGFTQPATIMMHAIGDNKPWNTRFFNQLIKSGHKPNKAEQTFFYFCKSPINIFSPFTYKMKKIDLLSASVLGRFIG
ncbi:MAG: hypothetical protein JWP81_2681 [Ferruginibacter sp.]|nr:hypothetical protein [Ferruginibacter sp.]